MEHVCKAHVMLTEKTGEFSSNHSGKKVEISGEENFNCSPGWTQTFLSFLVGQCWLSKYFSEDNKWCIEAILWSATSATNILGPFLLSSPWVQREEAIEKFKLLDFFLLQNVPLVRGGFIRLQSLKSLFACRGRNTWNQRFSPRLAVNSHHKCQGGQGNDGH